MKPFVKWAGGKAKLVENILNLSKNELSSAKKYCEPFVGGGALLFDLLDKYSFESIMINDWNKDLMITYSTIKNNVEDLIVSLNSLKEEYSNANDKKEIYLAKRDRYNSIKNSTSSNHIEIASLFIFLNKTCFNGLYRVNSKGLFNVPFNNAQIPPICDEENLRSVSKGLQNVEIRTGDYKTCYDFIDKNTFVYLDPPYRPLPDSNGFTSYTENSFDDNEQVKLAKFCKDISKIGAKFVLSNSDPKNTNPNDNFFDNLYKDFSINRIRALRNINSKGTGRGAVSELLITNIK